MLSNKINISYNHETSCELFLQKIDDFYSCVNMGYIDTIRLLLNNLNNPTDGEQCKSLIKLYLSNSIR